MRNLISSNITSYFSLRNLLLISVVYAVRLSDSLRSVCVCLICASFVKCLRLSVRMNCLKELRVGANPHTSLLLSCRRALDYSNDDTPVAFPSL